MAMKTEQKIYAATGVLIVLLGGLWLANKSEKDDGQNESANCYIMSSCLHRLTLAS